MTARYIEEHYSTPHHAFIKEADWTLAIYPKDNKTMTVSRNGVYKTIDIAECSDCVYRLTSTAIFAKGGASGLFTFIDDAMYNNFQDAFAWKILNWIFEHGK